MKTRTKWFIVGGLSLFGMVLCILWATPKQPRYEGRALSEWLADLSSGNYETQRLARVAIQEIGPASVPFLTNSLAQRNAISIRMYRQNFLPRKIAGWTHRVVKWQTPMMESRNAAIALQTLGPQASNAIPALVAAVGDQSWTVAQASAGALTAMGTNAVPALDARLSHAGQTELEWLLRTVAALGTNGARLAPKITPLLADPKLWGSAMVALIAMREGAVPAVSGALSSTDHAVQTRALSVLAQIGRAAIVATNAIIPLTTNESAAVRLAARQALAATMPPREVGNPVWLTGLRDPDPNNVELSLRLLTVFPTNVRAYNREIALLAQHSTNSIRETASNALTMFHAWPTTD